MKILTNKQFEKELEKSFKLGYYKGFGEGGKTAIAVDENYRKLEKMIEEERNET